jgi:hypothetical protein
VCSSTDKLDLLDKNSQIFTSYFGNIYPQGHKNNNLQYYVEGDRLECHHSKVKINVQRAMLKKHFYPTDGRRK